MECRVDVIILFQWRKISQFNQILLEKSIVSSQIPLNSNFWKCRTESNTPPFNFLISIISIDYEFMMIPSSQYRDNRESESSLDNNNIIRENSFDISNKWRKKISMNNLRLNAALSTCAFIISLLPFWLPWF
jgi:hypothetical protein